VRFVPWCTREFVALKSIGRIVDKKKMDRELSNQQQQFTAGTGDHPADENRGA
jgi:hypothetical protein